MQRFLLAAAVVVAALVVACAPARALPCSSASISPRSGTSVGIPVTLTLGCTSDTCARGTLDHNMDPSACFWEFCAAFGVWERLRISPVVVDLEGGSFDFVYVTEPLSTSQLARWPPLGSGGRLVGGAAFESAGRCVRVRLRTDSSVASVGFQLVVEGAGREQCPPGTFSATGALPCAPCPPGAYSAAVGATACAECGPGTFADTDASTACKSCSAGRYSGETGATSQLSCTVCSVGRYGVAEAATSASGCAACLPGTFSSEIAATTCVTCTPGTFSDAEATSACSMCEAGTYSTAFGARSSSTCVPCGPGTASASAGATSASACVACRAGTFNEQFAATSCGACAAGTFGNQTAAVNASSTCVPCGAGTFSSSLEGVSSCARCPAGTFSAAEGATSNATCAGCPAARFSDIEGATSNATCLPCPPGSFGANTSMAECEPCPAGTFSPTIAASSPLVCSACNGTGGWYCPAGSPREQACPRGKVCASPAFVAVDCPRGSYCPEGSTEPHPCPPGKVSLSAGAAECAECPARSEPVNASSCSYICFCAPVEYVAVPLALITVAVIVGMRFAAVSLPAGILISFSVGDLFSDIAYMSIEHFRTEELKVACAVFVFLQFIPFIFFFPPSMAGVSAGFRHWSLRGAPDDKFQMLPCLRRIEHAHAEFVFFLMNLVYNVLWWLVWLAHNAACLLFGLVVFPCAYLLLGVLGLVLYATKLLALPRVGGPWLSLWRYGRLEPEGVNVDGVVLHVFNQMLLAELLLESVPQLAVQLLNNVGAWSLLAVMSVVLTALVILSHVWKFGYYKLVLGSDLLDVPMVRGAIVEGDAGRNRSDTFRRIYGRKPRTDLEMGVQRAAH